ncbi:hypothetical protein HY417_04080 [Candidatus Kaiserbacteria bacterium]|nr:hypothetical protein [Candidatus Kaiserbacteria bacterium]
MERERSRAIVVNLREGAILALGATLIASIFLADAARAPISSAETRFVEMSPSGLQIVPASCASVPPNPHDGGSCSGGGACNINFTPSPVAQGESSTVYWSAPITGSSFVLSYPGGSNPVSNTGSVTVGGDQTKTYMLSYMSLFDSFPVSCSATLTVCPAGQIIQNGQCVPPPNDQCPSGQHFSGSSCLCDNTNQAPVNGQCPAPSGQCTMAWSPAYVNPGNNSTLYWNIPGPGIITYPGGSFPVTQSGEGGAGAGQSDMTYSFSNGAGVNCAATLHVCPAGTAANAQGTACVPIEGQCTPSYFCQGNDLYRRTAQCTNQFVQACTWDCLGGACLPPPPPEGNITATPSLVHAEETSQVSWTTQYTTSCTVSENNPEINDAWTGVSGTRTSSPLTLQTIYTLRCTGVDSSIFTDSVTVNIVPIFEEN